MEIECAHDDYLLSQLKQYKKNLESDAYEGPNRIVEIDSKTGQIVRAASVDL
jgi:hypothetical protein